MSDEIEHSAVSTGATAHAEPPTSHTAGGPLPAAPPPPAPLPSGEQDWYFNVGREWSRRVGKVNKEAVQIEGRDFAPETAMVVAFRDKDNGKHQIQVHERITEGKIENGEVVKVGWNRTYDKATQTWHRTRPDNYSTW